MTLETAALADPVTLAGALGDGFADPTLLRFDGPAPPDTAPDTRTLLGRVPAFTLAVGDVPAALADAFDLVAVTDADAARVEAAFARAPRAAVAAALLVRHPQPDPWTGLVAESTTYSMLQAGTEFARWLASHGPPRPACDDTPRVRVSRRGRAVEIVLTRPERHNALDTRMRDELYAALVGELGATGPIVVRGDGPSFCSGGDLDEFGTFPDPVTAHLIRLTRSLARCFSELSPRLVVGVHGACLGAGIELPAFAARVVAADDARFGLPELGLGLVPGAGGTVSIPRRVGRQRLLDLLVRDGTIPAPEAAAWGLVDEVVPRPQLESRVFEIVETMP